MEVVARQKQCRIDLECMKSPNLVERIISSTHFNLITRIESLTSICCGFPLYDIVCVCASMYESNISYGRVYARLELYFLCLLDGPYSSRALNPCWMIAPSESFRLRSPADLDWSAGDHAPTAFRSHLGTVERTCR